MDLKHAYNLALELMDKHGLLDDKWNFEFNRRKQSAGLCSYRNHTIYLSEPITSLSSIEDVTDTILHEIAHALTHGHGHDSVWRKKAIEIGANGHRCFDQHDKPSHANAVRTISKYKAVCINGHEHFANRKHKRRGSCPICSSRFDERYILEYKPNI